MLPESASILTSLAASNIRLFELAIVKFVPSPDIFSPASPNCNCMLAFNNKPVSCTCVNVTSWFRPNFITEASVCKNISSPTAMSPANVAF